MHTYNYDVTRRSSGFYIHSLFGTENDYALYQKTGHNRSLNRGKIDYNKINTKAPTPKNRKFIINLKNFYLYEEIKQHFIQMHYNSPCTLVMNYTESGDRALIKHRASFV
ncbi:MAG: hypothetical protein CM15mP69_7070 [Ectothiorhodospiraceae bacterium]|nr:MAG: hypothetical protein CM15mP69_7070 [Ectothiorhodospiraceae bacterium]